MENCILVKSDVAAKLLKMCDPGNHTININGNVYTITAADFVETMGIKSGTDKFGDLQNVQSWELFDKFCAYEKGDEKLPYICRKKVTDRLKLFCMNKFIEDGTQFTLQSVTKEMVKNFNKDIQKDQDAKENDDEQEGGSLDSLHGKLAQELKEKFSESFEAVVEMTADGGEMYEMENYCTEMKEAMIACHERFLQNLHSRQDFERSNQSEAGPSMRREDKEMTMEADKEVTMEADEEVTVEADKEVTVEAVTNPSGPKRSKRQGTKQYAGVQVYNKRKEPVPLSPSPQKKRQQKKPKQPKRVNN
ncbi:hypothetical protein L1887_30360 [Cichorium endivia]|nr:hypothetical protein L1887_30360 [Cichorium endivia]